MEDARQILEDNIPSGSSIMDKVRSGSRMFRIEVRRSVCVWLFPLLVAVLGWAVYDGLPAGIWLWPDTVVSLQASVVLYGPLVGGLAAWIPGREYRRGVENLLLTTSRPGTSRDLALWAATAMWCCLAYAAVVATFFLFTHLNATWGSPEIWPVLSTLIAILPHTALGYAAGRWFPGRYTAPLFAVAIYWLQIGMFLDWDSPLRNLLSLPDDSVPGGVFYQKPTDIYMPQAFWFLGLTALALAVVGLSRQRNPKSWAVLGLSVAVAVAGAVVLLRMPPQALAYEREAPVPYEPVCDEGVVPVCVHPAYENALPETVALVDDLVGPLVGLSGAPERAVQRGDASQARLLQNGTLAFDLYGGFGRWNVNNGTSFRGYMQADIARSLVSDSSGYAGEYEFYGDDPCAKSDESAYQARLAVMGWLLWQTERYDSMESEAFTDAMNDFLCPQTKDAIERFDALESGERREWFEDNYADLRTGNLALRELP